MPPFIVLLAIAALILFFAMLATRQAAMLRLAGYVTLRYANFPSQQALRTDVEQLLMKKAGVVST